MIQFLKNTEIDKKRWDACIEASPNGLIYSLSWYLDIVCPSWTALVSDDYSTVMPLPVRKKFGIEYLIRPYFTQQLGVFSQKGITKNLVEEFVATAKKHYRYANFQLNFANELQISIKQDVTYLLDLNAGLPKITSGFSDNTKRNIKKASHHGLIIEKRNNPLEFLEFYKEHGVFNPNSRFATCLSDLTNAILSNNKGTIQYCYSPKNELVSAVLWADNGKRAIYLVACNSAKGKELGANFLLINGFIEKNAEKNKVLDFEGSSIAGLARFYSSFGAQPQYFPTLKYNNLPFPLRLLKR